MDNINELVDNLFTGEKTNKKARNKNFFLYLGCLVVCGILGSGLVLHFFDKRGLNGEDVSSMVSDDITDNLQDEIPIEPEAYIYEHFVAPSNSFGIGNTTFKRLNDSYSQELFSNHFFKNAMYKRYSYSDWQDGSSYVGVDKTWYESGFWKINITLDIPVDLYEVNISFGCDLPVLDYVERDGTEIWINYSANSTETYGIFFNWSDLANIQGLSVTKHQENGIFWISLHKNNVPSGYYVFDPTFGHDGSYAYGVETEDQIAGGYFQMGSTGGTGDSITAKFDETGQGGPLAQCALYDSDKNYVANSVTDEHGVSGLNDYVTFDFVGTPTLEADAWYYIVAWSDGRAGQTQTLLEYDDSGGSGVFYDAETYNGFPATFAADVEDGDGIAVIYCSYTESAEEWSNTLPSVELNNPSPNGTTGVSILPSCSIWINDTDGNSTSVAWFTNQTGAWVNTTFYNNNVTANTTSNFTFPHFNTASTTYYWKVNVSDEYGENITWFSFTTEANASWQQIQEWNGSLYNRTSTWQTINEWNGSLYNSSTWQQISEWNGSLYNRTSTWQQIQEWNGSLYNRTSNWLSIQEWNGSLYNRTSNWLELQNWNGSLYNSSSWNSVSTWNGSLYNKSASWQQITEWNGSLYNFSDTIIFNVISLVPSDILINTTGTGTVTYNLTTQQTGLNGTSIFIAHVLNSTEATGDCQLNTSYFLEETPWLNSKYCAGNREEDYWFDTEFNASVGDGTLGFPGSWNVKNSSLTGGFTVNSWGDTWYNFSVTVAIERLFGRIEQGRPKQRQDEDKTDQYYEIYRDNISKVAFNMSNTCFWDNNHYNNTNYGFHIYAEPGVGTNKPLRVYFANSSYTGNPQISPYTEPIGQIFPDDTYGYSPSNSNYYHISFSCDSDGYVGTVVMTENFSIVFETAQANIAAAWRLYYADDNTTEGDHYHDYYNNSCTYMSTDDGITYVNKPGIIDSFIAYAKLDSTDELMYKVYAQMNGTATGEGQWSSIGTELIDEGNFPPNNPDVILPNGSYPTNYYTVGDIINITYGWLGDPNHETCWVNITAHNGTSEVVAYYIQNRSITDIETHVNNTWYYDWDTTGVDTGVYHINITVTDPSNAQAWGEQNGTFNLSEWTELQNWNGSLYNKSASWQQITEWNGSLYNSTPTWQNIVTWNGSLYNSTPAWQIVNEWNGSLYNRSSNWLSVITWNGSLYNSSSWNIINEWNGSLYNRTPTWQIINEWNGSLYNASVESWQQIQEWNGSLYNRTSSWIEITSWNGSLYNSSSWNNIETWNGSLYNKSASWQQITEWNGSLYNRTPTWQSIQEWNGSLYNATLSWQSIATWNGSLYNSSSWNNIETWNGSLYNKSASWQQITEWNGSLYNVSTRSWQNIATWNGSLYNASVEDITITNATPDNTTVNHILPSIYFTINSTNGNIMNYSIFWGTNTTPTTLLTTHNNISNGTYYTSFSNASNYTVTYYWRVMVWDGTGNFLNETFSLTTRHERGSRPSYIYAIVGLFGILGILSFVVNKKRRQR